MSSGCGRGGCRLGRPLPPPSQSLAGSRRDCRGGFGPSGRQRVAPESLPQIDGDILSYLSPATPELGHLK